jgi:hypothetical protein
MKKLLVAMSLVASIFASAQDQKTATADEEKLEQNLKMLFDSKIDMAIDNTVFTVNDGNSYFTEAQDAGLIGMIAPKSFEKMGKDLEKKSEGILDKGEMILDGQKVLFIKKSKEKDGKIFFITVYCKANDAESSMMVTSFFEKGKDDIYKPHAEKAIASAKLVK